MSRPRDRASAAGLLPRMEARPWTDGKTVTYRYHPAGGKPINLGTDRDGNPWNSGSFKSLWSRSMLDAIAESVLSAKQRFTFHSLRRYYATMHRAQHGDLPDLHADKRITSRVYDATKEIGRKAL